MSISFNISSYFFINIFLSHRGNSIAITRISDVSRIYEFLETLKPVKNLSNHSLTADDFTLYFIYLRHAWFKAINVT